MLIFSSLAVAATLLSSVSAQGPAPAPSAAPTAAPAPAPAPPAGQPAPAPAPPAGGQQQFPATPLASRTFSYPSGIPYQVDTEDLVRGHQHGYNICNGTTQNQNSLCQTSFVNSVDDFCLWAPPEPNSHIGDTEGEAVAWCTKPNHGTRLIPPGALQGVQFLKTPDYVAVVGFIDQTKINIAEGDSGGEMDPHGADLRGNPLGGLLYSNAFGGSNETFTQVIQWHNFMGNNFFCIKACDHSRPNDAQYCLNILDRIGCTYNVPNAAQNGTFESCDGENQDPPGVYTVNGAVQTYTQPPEELGAITSMPYQPRVPASSNCVKHQSAELFSQLNAAFPSSAQPSPTGSSGSPSSGSSNGSGSKSAGTPGATETSNSAVSFHVRQSSTEVGVMLGALTGVIGMIAGIAVLA